MGKRVYCLYRVSTKGQVEKDDIPMQKQRCHEFADENGWEIIREFSEKGISGYKVSVKKRDAMQEIPKGMPLRANLIFCWSLCLTGWAVKMTKRPLW